MQQLSPPSFSPTHSLTFSLYIRTFTRRLGYRLFPISRLQILCRANTISSKVHLYSRLPSQVLFAACSTYYGISAWLDFQRVIYLNLAQRPLMWENLMPLAGEWEGDQGTTIGLPYIGDRLPFHCRVWVQKTGRTRQKFESPVYYYWVGFIWRDVWTRTQIWCNTFLPQYPEAFSNLEATGDVFILGHKLLDGKHMSCPNFCNSGNWNVSLGVLLFSM